MLHKMLSLVLLTVMVHHPAVAGGNAAPSPNPGDSSLEAKLKARVLDIPAGAAIEVRLGKGEKIVGTIGEVSSESFTVESVGGDASMRREVSFGELRSVKTVHQSPSISRPLVKALFVMGVAFGLTAIAVAGMD